MTSLNISLPETMKAYVEGVVECGDYGTPSEYIRELIRQDKERKKAALERELLEGLEGPHFELNLVEVRKKGLINVLRERLKSVEEATSKTRPKRRA